MVLFILVHEISLPYYFIYCFIFCFLSIVACIHHLNQLDPVDIDFIVRLCVCDDMEWLRRYCEMY